MEHVILWYLIAQRSLLSFDSAPFNHVEDDGARKGGDLSNDLAWTLRWMAVL